MKLCIHKKGLFLFVALTSTFFFLSVYSFAQTSKNGESQFREAIRAAICKAAELKAEDCTGDFKYLSRDVDLNGDGKSEVIVWVASDVWGGTSGYPIVIFSRTENGYQELWSVDQAWTPIIILRSKSNGWQDIAFQFGGGGVKWYYQTLRYNGKKYGYATTGKKQPIGRVLIDKDFDTTIFGPATKP